MKLYMSDLYRCEVQYPLDDVEMDTLYYLYQPLMGSHALNLYMMLMIEGKRMSRFLKPSSLSRLISFLSMSLIDMEKALQALEGIGLLKTYVKHENEMTQYIFKLQTPLSLKAFFKNQILSSLLQESMSKEDFQKTIQYFRHVRENLDQYEEITTSFQDAYTIVYHRNKGRELKVNEDFLQPAYQDVETNYDYDLLYKSLADYQVNRILLNEEDFKYAIGLATVYSLDALTLAGFIKDSMESKGLNRRLLKSKIKSYSDINDQSSLNEVYHKQPIQYHTTDTQDSPVVLHMKYLDSITPYQLLKEKQGGKEPVFHDLMIVETLMMQLGLKPAVVNVLIEYVLGKNDNRLSKRYCEAIGASWARQKIETAMDAYHALMAPSSSKESTPEEETKAANQNVIDELPLLLQQLKEGQL